MQSFACWRKGSRPSAAGVRPTCITMPSTSACADDAGARFAAITSGGAIPDTADYAVVLEPSELVIGSVNEDFAIESLQGDIFQLGNTSWRVLRVEQGKVRVEDAHGQPPSIPFWLGEAPARTHELSVSVSRLREEVANRVEVNDNVESVDGRPNPRRD